MNKSDNNNLNIAPFFLDCRDNSYLKKDFIQQLFKNNWLYYL
ncbi:hypothetical protein CCAN12_730001 [Capnocytophaga canimorsus]|uniref:Uncharacterized protein n=1 Tax=Capnocytophaga canimorsus TaxID=28188 RepID=A0A0B7HHY3_9FLAO|nr:hypothetical protein CCAN12_730001 [Capnocytophaga canimorsus]